MVWIKPPLAYAYAQVRPDFETKQNLGLNPAFFFDSGSGTGLYHCDAPRSTLALTWQRKVENKEVELSTLSKNQWKVPGYPVTQVPLENSVVSHWKFSEIPLETS